MHREERAVAEGRADPEVTEVGAEEEEMVGIVPVRKEVRVVPETAGGAEKAEKAEQEGREDKEVPVERVRMLLSLNRRILLGRSFIMKMEDLAGPEEIPVT